MKSPFSIRRRNDVLCLLSTCNIGMFMKSDMYSKHAEQYDLVVQDNIYNAHFERPSLQAMLDDLSGKDVLDLGCGSGVYAEFLIKQGLSNITCIDASEEMIELVRNKLGGAGFILYSGFIHWSSSRKIEEYRCDYLSSCYSLP